MIQKYGYVGLMTIGKKDDGEYYLVSDVDPILAALKVAVLPWKQKVTDLEEDARRFPTLAEFSNLQDDYGDAKEQIATLTAHIDLMLDEFRRITACPGVTDEIKGLCVRGQQGIEQTVPVIAQRDKALKQIATLTAENQRLRERLYSHGDIQTDEEDALKQGKELPERNEMDRTATG